MRYSKQKPKELDHLSSDSPLFIGLSGYIDLNDPHYQVVVVEHSFGDVTHVLLHGTDVICGLPITVSRPVGYPSNTRLEKLEDFLKHVKPLKDKKRAANLFITRA
jgi:hypothetical protein